jgi:hypothetical protein
VNIQEYYDTHPEFAAILDAANAALDRGEGVELPGLPGMMFSPQAAEEFRQLQAGALESTHGEAQGE